MRSASDILLVAGLIASAAWSALAAGRAPAGAAPAPKSQAAPGWPQFRGPDGTGISPEKGLARAWPEAGPKVLWTAEVGPGFGGPAVRDGRVYLLDRIGDHQDVLRCLDLKDGAERWRYAYDAPGDYPYPGSRTVPTVTDDMVYTAGPLGHLNAVRLATHRPAWSVQVVEAFRSPRLPRDLQVRRPQWGFAQHPVLYRDWLIVAPHALEAGIVALDRATGEVRWRSRYIGINLFSSVTPYVTALGGVEQVVMVAIADNSRDPPAVVSGVEAATGRLLWQLETWKKYNCPIPMPVRTGPDRLFIAGGYTIGCFGLKVRPGRTGADAWHAEYEFRDNMNCTPQIHTPILYRGHLYAQSFDAFHNRRNHGLVCLTPEGRLVWQSADRPADLAIGSPLAPPADAASPGPRPDGPARGLTFDQGNLLIAEGLIYVMDGRRGDLWLVEATPEEFRPLAKAHVLDARFRKVWAPMALAEGKLLVRDDRCLKCLDVRHP